MSGYIITCIWRCAWSKAQHIVVSHWMFLLQDFNPDIFITLDYHVYSQTKCTKQPALPLSEFNGSEHIWSIKYCGQFEMYIYLFFFLFVFIYLFFHKNWAECSIAQRGGNYPAGAEHTQMPFKKTLDSKPCETVVPLSIFSLACSLKKTYCKCLSYIIYIFFYLNKLIPLCNYNPYFPVLLICLIVISGVIFSTMKWESVSNEMATKMPLFVVCRSSRILKALYRTVKKGHLTEGKGS